MRPLGNLSVWVSYWCFNFVFEHFTAGLHTFSPHDLHVCWYRLLASSSLGPRSKYSRINWLGRRPMITPKLSLSTLQWFVECFCRTYCAVRTLELLAVYV